MMESSHPPTSCTVKRLWLRDYYGILRVWLIFPAVAATKRATKRVDLRPLPT